METFINLIKNNKEFFKNPHNLTKFPWSHFVLLPPTTCCNLALPIQEEVIT